MKTRFKRAFTLLEVIVALAILAVSLVTILNISAQAINSHIYAKKLTVATLLARSKMIDLEQTMHDKGLSVDDDEDSGDFTDEGWPMYKWRAKIIAPKTKGLSPEQLFGALFNLPMGGEGAGGLLGGLFGAGNKTPPGGATPPTGAGGAGGLLAAMGPAAGIAGQQFTAMVDQLQKSVREVHLTVFWKDGNQTESIDLVTHVVSLGPGSDRNGGAAAASGSATAGTAAEQWVRADTGTVVPNAQPGPNGQGMVDPRDGAQLITAAQFAQQRGLPGPNGQGIINNQLQQLLPGGVGKILKGSLLQ